jgi:hypothetical protein
MLKKMKAKIKKKSFLFIEKTRQISDLFRDVFQYAFILTLKDLVIAISQYHLPCINEQIDSIRRTAALRTYNDKDLR